MSEDTVNAILAELDDRSQGLHGAHKNVVKFVEGVVAERVRYSQIDNEIAALKAAQQAELDRMASDLATERQAHNQTRAALERESNLRRQMEAENANLRAANTDRPAF